MLMPTTSSSASRNRSDLALPQGPRDRTKRLFAAAAVVIALVPAPACAVAATGNQAATRVYLRADYRLMRAATSRIPAIEAALRGLLGAVQQECPMVAAGAPQDAQSAELEDEVIGAMITSIVGLDRTAGRVFVAAAEPLTWSDRRLTRRVRGYARKIGTLLALPEPNLCADVRSWVTSGFTELSAGTLTFTPRFTAAWVPVGELPSALARFETSAQRPLFARTRRLEQRFEDFEAREANTYSQIMSAIGLGD